MRRKGFLRQGYTLGKAIGAKTDALANSVSQCLEDQDIEKAMVLISIAACSQHVCIHVPDCTRNIETFLFGLSLAIG